MSVRDLLVIVKSHGQHTYLQRIIKSSKPELYENASLSFSILYCKHSISMYFMIGIFRQNSMCPI